MITMIFVLMLAWSPASALRVHQSDPELPEPIPQLIRFKDYLAEHAKTPTSWSLFEKSAKRFSEFSAKEEWCMQNTPVVGTMKSWNKFHTLLSLAHKASKVPGDFVMAGIAQGGDAYGVLFFLACSGNLQDRQVHLFDTWEGLPAAVVGEDKGFQEGWYRVNFNGFVVNGISYGKLYDSTPNIPGKWKDSMAHVVIHKGLFVDTMPNVVQNMTLAFLSCDGDMYASTRDCLQSSGNRVVAGGPIYQDDYYTFFGNYKAVQDYRNDMHINDDVAPIYVVPQKGDPNPIEEHGGDSNCKPPVDNSPRAGTCNGKDAEAAFWIHQ